MASTEHKAVIDRIEDNAWAVLLIGQEQREKVIPVEQLPKEAKEGTWLRLRLEEDIIREIIVDAEETTALRSRMASKLDQLRSRQRHFQPVNEADTQKQAPKEPQTPPAPNEPKASEEQKASEEPKASQKPKRVDKPKAPRKPKRVDKPMARDEPKAPEEPQPNPPSPDDLDQDDLDMEWYE